MLADYRLHDALWRQFLFSGLVLLIEMPLGILIALAMPKKGWGVPVCLITIALPLLIPWNTIGTIWMIFTRPDIGLFGAGMNNLMGIPFDHTDNWLDAWITVMLMEVWHWTPLVVLLAYAGLRAIPEAYYQAARIDGASAWSTFIYIQLPKMRGVLTIAFLLRFMDSFLIYVIRPLSSPFIWSRSPFCNSTWGRAAPFRSSTLSSYSYSVLYFTRRFRESEKERRYERKEKKPLALSYT